VTALQWGGRFTAGADTQLLAFGSSLEEDLVLARFDVACSLGHVEALEGGKIVTASQSAALRAALRSVEIEIGVGSFEAYARATQAEDVHGAIDARVRELAGAAATTRSPRRCCSTCATARGPAHNGRTPSLQRWPDGRAMRCARRRWLPGARTGNPRSRCFSPSC
jgi:hypothetical protein